MAGIVKGGTATVTGAASGIGRATALAFARQGCENLALGDIAAEGPEETKKLIRNQYPEVSVEVQRLDVGEEKNVDAFFNAVVTKFGRIDFAANVAGYGGTAAPSTEMSEEEHDKAFADKQRGVFLCERAQLRQMVAQEPLKGFESRGSIVNVTSLCAMIAMPGLAAYSASKAGAMGLARVDALDFGPQKIRINTVAPGNVETPMLLSTMGKEHGERYAASTQLRRLAAPEDIANAIVWLSGSQAQYITGITLPVDGGLAIATGPP